MKSTLELMPLAALALSCSCVVAGPASTVTLDGDYGCDTLQTQVERLAALNVAIQTSMMKARGMGTDETQRLNGLATTHFTELSSKKCRPLNGTFRVLDRQAVVGGSVWNVKASKGETLWVLMK